MDGREVHCIERKIGLSIESLVRTVGIVNDVETEVLVVPSPSVLAPDLLSGYFGVRSRAAADRLVIGQQGAESCERPEPVHLTRVPQVPTSDRKFREKLVELADKIGGPSLTGNGFAPLSGQS